MHDGHDSDLEEFREARNQRQASGRRLPTNPAPIRYDRLAGWIAFFVVLGLCAVALTTDPTAGSIPGVTARDIGGDTEGEPTAGPTEASTEADADSESVSENNDGEANSETGETEAGGGVTDATDVSDGGTVTLAFTGDVLVHESVAGNAATNPGYDFSPQFRDVAPILQRADLAICHLETPISSDNTSLSYYPAFLVPTELAAGLSGAGFNGCSVASNHALDAGESGLQSTFEQLERAGLGISGIAGPADQRARSTAYRVREATIGHLSYTYGLNGLEPSGRNAQLTNLIDASVIEADAASLKSQGADFVVVSMHWGTEYTTGLNEQQAALGPQLIASDNIDLLVGHHAHVVQQVSEYDGEFVAYGLGNFLSNQSGETCSPCPDSTQDGVILLVDIAPGSSGSYEVTDLRAVATWVDRTNGHVIRVVDATATGEGATSAQRTAEAIGGDSVSVAFTTQ